GTDLMSVQKGTSASSITITISVLGFSPESTITASNPAVVTFGGNQANGAIKCTNPGDTGNNFPTAIQSGCQDPVQTVQLPYVQGTTTCANNTANPPCFVTEQPGNGTP